MDKYIAFISGQQSSAIMTKEKAVEWAKTQLGNRMSVDRVQIAEVTNVVRRTAPTVEIVPFEQVIPKT